MRSVTSQATSEVEAPAQRRITVILDGSGGELERVTVDVLDGDDPDEAVNLAAHGVLDGWILSVGDVVRITEEQP